MPGLPWRPIITYGSPSTQIALALPQELWLYQTFLRGGARVSSAGIPESFVTREDNMAAITLRVEDCELLAVRAWILDAMRGNQFTFQFDSLDPYTAFICYLDAPTFDDGFKPRRMANWPNVWEVPVTIRAVQQVPIFVSTSGLCEPTGTLPVAWILSGNDASALPNGSGRYILELNPIDSTWPPSSLVDPSAAGDFTPVGFPAPDIVYRSINPIVEWVTRRLTAGYVIPSTLQIGGSTSGSPSADWWLQDAIMVIRQERDGVVIATAAMGDIASFGWLGGSDYATVDVSDAGVFAIEQGDQVVVQAFSRYEPRSGGDSSGRLSLTWGAVPGPLTTTKVYGYANVTELAGS